MPLLVRSGQPAVAHLAPLAVGNCATVASVLKPFHNASHLCGLASLPGAAESSLVQL